MIKILGVLFLTAIITAVLLLFSSHALPGSGFYPFRRVYEKLVLLSQLTREKKAEYYRYLLKEREKELQYEYKDWGTYGQLSSALRYSTTIGEATNLILSRHMTREAPLLLKDLSGQKKQIIRLRDSYPHEEKKFLDDDIHYLEFYSSELLNVK